MQKKKHFRLIKEQNHTSKKPRLKLTSRIEDTNEKEVVNLYSHRNVSASNNYLLYLLACLCLLYLLVLGWQQYVKIFAFFSTFSISKHWISDTKFYVSREQQSRDRRMGTENNCLKRMANWQLLNYFVTTFTIKTIKSCIKTTAGVC